MGEIARNDVVEPLISQGLLGYPQAVPSLCVSFNVILMTPSLTVRLRRFQSRVPREKPQVNDC